MIKYIRMFIHTNIILIRIYSNIHSYQYISICHTLVQTWLKCWRCCSSQARLILCCYVIFSYLILSFHSLSYLIYIYLYITWFSCLRCCSSQARLVLYCYAIFSYLILSFQNLSYLIYVIYRYDKIRCVYISI